MPAGLWPAGMWEKNACLREDQNLYEAFKNTVRPRES